MYDTLTGRVFGCLLLEGEEKIGALEAVGTRFVMRAAALGLQPVELTNWRTRAVRLAKEAATAQAAMERTRRWWNEFWEKSHVFVQGDAPVVPEYEDYLVKLRKEVVEADGSPSAVMRAYIHTRYLFACCETGEFCIPFNGAVFNPDERPWGQCNLWQNLRLP